MEYYHISPDGNPRRCYNPQKCKYKTPLEEHYRSKKEAIIAYENKNNSIPKTLKNYYKPFSTKTDKYGIHFSKPDLPDVYLDGPENDGDCSDPSEYYRSDIVYDIFEDYNINDVQKGYSMNVGLNSLQKFVDDKILKKYENQKEIFNIKNMKPDSLPPTLLVCENKKLFIIEGNHRFAAAKKKKVKYWNGIVIEYNQSKNTTRIIKPDEFNKNFQKN